MGKLFKSSFIYFIGMTLVIIGLLCPIAKFPAIGEANVFKFVNFENFNICSASILLIAIGAILGVLFSILTKADKTHRLIALAITLTGGVIFLLYMTGVIADNKVAGAFQKKILGSSLLKNTLIGSYLMLAGWIVAIYGWATGQ